MKGPVVSPQARARRKRFWVSSFAHVLLLVGCIVFGFPFYWLLSTSVKEQDELFADPPVWVPQWPARIAESPYFAQDEYRFPQAPEGVSAETFRTWWPEMSIAVGELFREKWLEPQGIDVPIKSEAQHALASGLYTVILPRLPAETAREVCSASPEEALAEIVTERDLKTVWANVRRSLVIRGVTVQDQGFVQYKLGDDSPEEVWTVSAGEADLKKTQLGNEPAAQVDYRFSGDSAFTLEADLESPMDASQFRRLTIPIRADKSWHTAQLRVDVGGQVYESTESLVLFSDLSQEAAWQIPDEDRVGASAFRDYMPLRSVGTGDAPPDRVRVALTFHRSSTLGVAWQKARRNYRDALNFVPMGTYFRNTLILVILNVLGQLFSCSVVAYAFARLKWPGRDISFGLVLSTMMLPAQVTMIPVFLIYRYLGWYDTLQPLWVGSLFGSAFFIFLLRQFMRTIPGDLEDAAKIDGCTFFGLYWRIILPLMKPALAAVAIFSFMNAWNEFMGPLIYLNDQRLYPLSLGLYQFRIEHAADYGMLMAASALMIIPVVIIFFLAQKHFIQGVQLTGMKG